MTYKNAQYTENGGISVEWSGKKLSVPNAPANRHFAELKELEAAGEITIAPYVPPTEQELLEEWRATTSVSKFQAKAALAQAGLLDQVKQAVASADTITQLAWEDATEFNRNSPTIAALSQALGLTDEQVDDLFKQADQIAA